jgi:hypothetical protein
VQGFGCGFLTMDNQIPPVYNENDLFMHFLAMSHNGQVATDKVQRMVAVDIYNK